MSDYAKKTARLTLAQHGAYTLLLDEIYSTESPLPADIFELYRICRAMTKEEQLAVKTVADAYFAVSGDGLRHNPRATAELHAAAPAMEAARLNGVKGGRPKKEPIGLEINNPVGFQSETQTEPRTKPPHSSDEYQVAKATLSPAKLPTCPHETLIDLFAEHLPTLPQPKKELWAGKNAEAMRARWKWLLSAKKKNGDRYATTPEEAINWFARFFAYVGTSDFLSGASGKWTGCDLGWLMKADNFAKVVSGNYDQKVAA